MEAINTTRGHLSAHMSRMETLDLRHEVMGAKFKFKRLSKQCGCYDGSKFRVYGKVTGLKSAYFQVPGSSRRNVMGAEETAILMVKLMVKLYGSKKTSFPGKIGISEGTS